MFMDELYLDNDFRALFLSFYCFYFVAVVVVSGFVMLSLLLSLLYFFIIFVLILCDYVRYYFVRLLEILIIYVRAVCIPFYVVFNVCNFSFALFIALSLILFCYLLTSSHIKFPYSIIVMTILL